jgi:Replication protein C N-terminal domain
MAEAHSLGNRPRSDTVSPLRRLRRHEKTGHIIEAYGFDLSLLTARHAEFLRLAEEGRAERAAMGRLRRRATIARKAITQILETARNTVSRARSGSQSPAKPRPSHGR